MMVRALLNMEEVPEPADAADALAVALCHLQNEQFRARFALPPAAQLRSARAVAPRVTHQRVTRIQSAR